MAPARRCAAGSCASSTERMASAKAIGSSTGTKGPRRPSSRISRAPLKQSMALIPVTKDGVGTTLEQIIAQCRLGQFALVEIDDETIHFAPEQAQVWMLVARQQQIDDDAVIK